MVTTEENVSMRPRQPDKYFGQRDFLLLGNWIFSVDQYIVLSDMPEAKQAPFVSTLLRKEALLWYRVNYENWDTETKGTLTWKHLKAAMKLYFAPPNEDRRLQDEWANLRQQGTVFEYISVLSALAMQIEGLTEGQILDKFIRGLKPKTRIEVELRDPKSTEEAYRLADRFDRIVYGVNSSTFLTSNYNRYGTGYGMSHEAKQNEEYYGEPMQIDTLRPRKGFGKPKPRPAGSEPLPPRNGLCFNCQKPGHIAVNCPKPRRNKYSGNGRRQ
jgi:hypothetical protein